MNKTACLVAIYLLCVCLVGGIFHSFLFITQGPSFIYLQSYATWFIIFNVIYLLAYLFVLRYLQLRQSRFVFIGALISTILFTVSFIFQYIILIRVAREWIPYQFIIALLGVLCSVIFGYGLIVEKKKNMWLKSLGILVALDGSFLIIVSLFAGALNMTPQSSLVAVSWLNAVASLFPIFFVAVLVREINTTAQQPQPGVLATGAYNFTGAVGLIGAMALLSIGTQLSKESYWARDWQKRGPEESRKLAERFESRIFVNRDGDTLRYLLITPIEYDSTQKYPIVTILHGGPTRTKSIEVTQPASLLSEPGNRKKYPAFIFVPQAPPGILWGGVPGIRGIDSLVFDAMTLLEDQYSIDEKRRYITGISGGGYGTWHFITTHPDMFAAAMPLCGSGDPTLASAARDVPVWAFHGDADRNVPVQGSRDMIEALRKAGAHPRYNEFAGVGHDVWPAVSETDGVLDWLFAQQRK